MNMIGKKNKRRFWELDFLRGICVSLMVFDHFMYSAGSVFPSFREQFGVSFWDGLIEFSDYYWMHNARAIVRFVIIGMFMVLCGISCTLSKSNLKRGIKTCLCAAIITFFTYLFSRYSGFDATIRFGVIHMLGVSILIYFLFQLPRTALKRPLEKLSYNHKKLSDLIDLFLRLLPSLVGITALAIYFCSGWGEFAALFNSRGEKYTDIVSNAVYDGEKYRTLVSMFFDVGGNNPLSGADYFSILPYGALVLAGGMIGELVYRNRLGKPVRYNPSLAKPVEYIGRHALIAYLAHQVVIATFFFIAAWVVSL